MAKKKNDLPTDVQEATERVLLAGVGALAVTEKQGSKLFKKLVKKGKKYNGAGLEQVEQIRKQVEGRAGQVKRDVDQQTGKVKKVIDTQVDKVLQVADGALGGLEQRVQDAVTVALQGLGIPTRDEIAALRTSVHQLSKNLDALRKERAMEAEAQPEVEARATGNGWYEVVVHGAVTEKVHGEDEAVERVAELQRENATLTAAERAAGVEAVQGGGGWYQVKLHGLVVGKVQGKSAAETAVAELEAQR
ncbi:MAG: phasin family protein [Bacteroidota bacterium]